MLVRFWGTFGSLPAPVSATDVRGKLRAALTAAAGRTFAGDAELDAFIDGELTFDVRGTYGGDTSCVELTTGGDDYVICDAGSGLRTFGERLVAERGPTGHTIHLFQSHLHWDHLMGFPFFVPAYISGNRIIVYGCHANIREAYQVQMSAPFFPVDFSRLGASVEFVRLEPGQDYQIAGLTMRAMKQYHAGDSYGFRFSRNGKTVIYATDSEHKFRRPEDRQPFIDFFRDADLLIFDAMYTLVESLTLKEDWGHSSNVVGIELAQAAGVRMLALFHHDPSAGDGTITRRYQDSQRYQRLTGERMVEVITAYDGLEVTV
ncbi:MAG TPA: MBL fold metallo-hydrolase [Azospirillaceae bacterium]|nr:MBL fold metallo-hydrolase [Azospirillaceae bacterium]